jgi:hemerythrin superfamily protein
MATATQSSTSKSKSSSSRSKSASSKSTSNSKSASSSKSTGKKTSTSTRTRTEAVAMLKRDHRTVEKLFRDFEKSKDDNQKMELAQQIIMELRIHTTLEEEILYPASREWVKDEEMVNEAEVEHQAAKDLMAQIEKMKPADQYFDAKVSVLKEMIQHHVEEEEKEYFPQLEKTDMDLKAIGQQMTMRKEALMGEMGGGMSRAKH